MISFAVLVFAAVYLGMALGRLPGLAIDRTGVALLGLIALLASGDLSLAEAGAAVDLPTIALLFALMILSAQFELCGFYAQAAHVITVAARSPHLLLAAVVAVTGALAAFLSNDVVVFALTPLLTRGLLARGLDPRPHLVALAGAANAGSAATLIGNPQNILIGQAGNLDFTAYLALALPPALFALACVFAAVAVVFRRDLTAPMAAGEPLPPAPPDRFQLLKGVVALVALVGLFSTPFPRELSALGVAGLLLLSRRMSSREMIGAADWHLLLLFVCLFGITSAFAETGLAQQGLSALAAAGIVPERLLVLAPLLLLASNTIGNVPATILLLAVAPGLSPDALSGVALLSTLAGNLLLTGSLCNIIVAERARSAGAHLGFADFAKAGILMTLASMAAASAWLWLAGAMRP